MNDRELLLAAAKVAGIEHPGGEHSSYDDGRLWDCKALRWWNPLTDDGDALRLLSRLQFELRHAYGRAHVGRQGQFWYSELYNGDIDAAIRRAIVRAAASFVQHDLAFDTYQKETN